MTTQLDSVLCTPVPGLLALLPVLLLGGACTPSEAGMPAQAAPSGMTSAESAAAVTIADVPLERYRSELLQLGFEAVSGMPLMPHVKNRSRGQDRVVEACFELGQPQRGLAYVQSIANWRRGVGYARYAAHCAQVGAHEKAQTYIALAEEQVLASRAEDEQGWRIERIQAGIAKALLHLGQEAEAARLVRGMQTEAETGSVGSTRALLLDDDEFDDTLESLRLSVELGSLDHVRNAVQIYARLFERFYADAARRSAIEREAGTAARKIPPTMYAEFLMDLVDVALEHGDTTKGLDLLEDARERLASVSLSPNLAIPLGAQLGALRYRAGEPDSGRAEVNAALDHFGEQKELIVSIDRADALRPVAEAYMAMDDLTMAREVYALAIEEGFGNPNSRPRADDLQETTTSMAKVGFEPDDALWARLREIAVSLGDPW